MIQGDKSQSKTVLAFALTRKSNLVLPQIQGIQGIADNSEFKINNSELWFYVSHASVAKNAFILRLNPENQILFCHRYRGFKR